MRPTRHLSWLREHFRFRGLWEDEMFARQGRQAVKQSISYVAPPSGALTTPPSQRTARPLPPIYTDHSH